MQVFRAVAKLNGHSDGNPALTERPERLCVLIVDDCVDTTTSLALLLGRWGYRVKVANNGATALQLLAEQLFDVVLLDIGMPHMTGWELARRLRGWVGMEHALLVAVSGFGQAEDERHSLAVGCDFHLIKPVEPDQLQQLLIAREKESQAHVSREPHPSADRLGHGC